MVERAALVLGMMTAHDVPSKELRSQGYRLEEMVGHHPSYVIELHYADASHSFRALFDLSDVSFIILALLRLLAYSWILIYSGA